MSAIHILFCGLAALVAASLNAQTKPVVLQSGERQIAVLELYTSEGCSSCPPAETWLSRLREAPGLWKDFVPLAFHVDYWDYLGWRDPWGSREYSNRQRAYRRIVEQGLDLHPWLCVEREGMASLVGV